METRFLGRIQSRDGSCLDPQNIKKIIGWPTRIHEQSLMSAAFITSRAITEDTFHIPNFAKLTLPLTDLMKGCPWKGSKIRWTEREEECLYQLKKAFKRLWRHNQSFVTSDESTFCYQAPAFLPPSSLVCVTYAASEHTVIVLSDSMRDIIWPLADNWSCCCRKYCKFGAKGTWSTVFRSLQTCS